jgi:hypothetical protein
MAIQYACQQPGLENLRALALEGHRNQPSDPNTFTQLGASAYFRHFPAAMSSCIPGSVGG